MIDVTIEVIEETGEAWSFSVRIEDGENATEHTVTVERDYWEQLTGGNVEPADLVRRSLVFLLEREPKEAILDEFRLQEIERYFPEYPEAMREEG